jgi:hypothetical protein
MTYTLDDIRPQPGVQELATPDPGAPPAPGEIARATDAGKAPSRLAEAPPPPPAPRRTPRGAAALAGFPWEASPIASVSAAEIRAELARRERRAAALLAERAQVMQALDQIEAALADIGKHVSAPHGAATARPGPVRAPRTGSAGSLKEAIAAAVEPDAVVTPAQVAELVRGQGYVSSAANFGQMVANTLAKDARFTREGRGRYRRGAG